MKYAAQLSEKILKILEPFSVPTEAHSRLLRAYSEPWRTYHNASHILQMLELSCSLDINLDDDGRQRLNLMILYHDAWYKVGRPAGENEHRSAEWAYGDIDTDNISESAIRLRRAVKQGIVATSTHSLEEINPDYVEEIATLLDLDLWGLGQARECFRENTEKIWWEYQPTMTREEFDNGRSVWAHSFLNSRDSIYHTEPFLHLEEMARRNLTTLVRN